MNAFLSSPVAMLLAAGFLLTVVLSAGATLCVLQLLALRRRVARQQPTVTSPAVPLLEPLPRPPDVSIASLAGNPVLATCLTMTSEEVNRCACNTDFVALVADDAIFKANEDALEAALAAATAGASDVSRAAAPQRSRPLSAAVNIFAVCGRWPRIPGKRQTVGRG